MHAQNLHQAKLGFTLVELSIVLVIIGLLIGGILVGQSLIESAKIHNVINEWKQYEIMANLYKSKFKNLPGDDSQAWLKFGGDAVSTCGLNTDVNSDALGCNGNGDNFINGTEGRRAWHHLRLAQILTDKKTVTPHNGWYNVPNPAEKKDKNFWLFQPRLPVLNYSPYICNNSFMLYPSLSGGGLVTYSGTYTMALDSKADDGKPNTGLIEGKSNGQACKSGTDYNTTDAIVCTPTLCIATN